MSPLISVVQWSDCGYTAHIRYNRIGGHPLFEWPTFHRTVRTVRYTAPPLFTHQQTQGVLPALVMLFSVIPESVSAPAYTSCSTLSLCGQSPFARCFLLLTRFSVTFIYYHLQGFRPSQCCRQHCYYGFIWLLTTNLISTVLPHVRETSPGKNAVFLSIHLPHLHKLISCSYWTLTCLAALSSVCAWCDFCSSGQRFAAAFLHTPPRGGRAWSWLYTSHYRACSGLSPVRLRPCRAH